MPPHGSATACGDNKDHYESLGVDSTATAKNIRQAFRTKAKHMHPDRGGSPEAFKNLANAYDVLSTPAKRRVYDGSRTPRRGASKCPQRRGKKSPHVNVRVSVTLAELYHGGAKKVRYECDVIKGPDGKTLANSRNATLSCGACAGTGTVVRTVHIALSFTHNRRRPCRGCGGWGRQLKNGYRRMCDKRTETIHLRLGQKNGSKITRRGLGHAQLDGTTGDAVFVLYQEADGMYASKGTDLIIRPSLSLVDALCGTRLHLRHPRGAPVVLVSDKCVLRPSVAYVINGLGMPSGLGVHGRLLIIPMIRFPPTLSASQKTAVRLAIDSNNHNDATASPTADPPPAPHAPTTSTPNDKVKNTPPLGYDDASVYHILDTTESESDRSNTVQCPQQ